MTFESRDGVHDNFFIPGVPDENSSIRQFSVDLYGRFPSERPDMKADVFEEGPILDPKIGEEKGFRRQVRLTLTREGKSVTLLVLMHIPKGKGPFPAIIFENIYGNHSTTADTKVEPSEAWTIVGPRSRLVFDPSKRGNYRSRFDTEEVIKNGVAAVTLCYSDIVPDAPIAKTEAAYGLYPELHDGAEGPGAVAMWGWGYSRVMDYLETDPLIDARNVGLMGFSRTGKAVLPAALYDGRFSVGIPVASGVGGVKPLESDEGEHPGFMARVWPHWMSKRFAKLAQSRKALAFDSPALLSRVGIPLLALAGKRDTWTGPESHKRAVAAANALKRNRGERPLHLFEIHPGGHEVPQWWSRLAQFVKEEGSLKTDRPDML